MCAWGCCNEFLYTGVGVGETKRARLGAAVIEWLD